MIRHCVAVVAVFLFVFHPGGASAEELLSLSRAIDTALSKNPRVLTSSHAVDAAEANIIKARSGYYPKIDLSEIYQRTTNPMWAFGHKLNQESITSADFSPSELNDPDPIDNWGTVLTLTQPLYTGGKVSGYHSQATLNRDAARKEKERTEQEVVFEVTRNYYGISLAMASLDVIRDALKTAEANMDTARHLFEAGVVVESGFLAARVMWAEIKEDELKAENNLVMSKATLNSLLGEPLEADFIPSERLDDGLEGIRAGAAPVPDVDPLKERPDMAGMELKEGILNEGVRIARAGYLPSASLIASYEIDGESMTSADGTNWTVMGVLKWNLYSGKEDTANLNEALAYSAKIKEMKRGMEYGIKLEALNARLELKAARERILVAEESVKQAREGYRIVEDRYAEGMTTIVDLLSAQTSLKKARLGLTQALHDYKVGEARLRLALGMPR